MVDPTEYPEQTLKILRTANSLEEADEQISSVKQLLKMWGIKYTYEVSEENHAFEIIFTLCGAKKSKD